MKQDRITNEIEHGKLIARKGEQIWNWSSPAGLLRWQRRSKLFVEFLGNNNANVLEIGCGTGLFSKEISQTKNMITSIDISPDLIEIARQRVNLPNITFTQEDAHHTRFDDNSFDFIVGSSVLHHLNIDMALKEFFRLLKPDGKLMFTEPNMMNPQIMVQKNIPFVKKFMGDSPDETAFFRWEIKNRLFENNYKNIQVTPFDFMHPALPKFLLKGLDKMCLFCESVPVIKEIAGSLIITASK